MTSSNKIYWVNIEDETVKNTNFRKVLNTTSNLQLVLMNIEAKDNIPRELHKEHDQFIRIESGEGEVVITDENNKEIEKHILEDGVAIVIPRDTWHEIKNTSDTKPLKLYSIYSPPEHPPNRIDIKKPEEKKEQTGGNIKVYKIRNRYN